MDRLDGKVAVITGASSGIGRAIALLFASEGAKVVCGDLQRQPNADGFEDDLTSSTDEAIRLSGGQAIFATCDVRKLADVHALVGRAVETYGRLDVMVNNAGIYRVGQLLHEFTEEDLDACYSVNTKGSFFGMQEAVKQFLKQGDGGSIVNIISTAGLGAHPRQCVYNASKGAVARLTECVAIEYGRNDIRVNGICPSAVKTSMWRPMWEDQALIENHNRMLPLHRMAEVEDVANLALFLASDESAFMTGALIRVDGGEQLSRFSV
jgi:NAD(P)-dependent dehydrogenase (short-subunit alcohol dehydrogenase family)